MTERWSGQRATGKLPPAREAATVKKPKSGSSRIMDFATERLRKKVGVRQRITLSRSQRGA